ncbi:MAG: fibronectin type III-like domain-contianing protein [Rhizomicrobium sp.]
MSVDVKNTGTRPATRWCSLYLHQQVASVTRPVKELKGFQRVTLTPGESKTLTFTIGSRELRMFDENMKRVVEAAPSTSWSGAIRSRSRPPC